MAQMFRKAALLAFVVSVVSACGQQPIGKKMRIVPSVSDAEWSVVAGRRILFAHQSVGRDMMSGLAELASGRGVDLNVVEARRISSDAPGLYHFAVGENGDAPGKLRDLQEVATQQNLSTVDMVLLKLCYVDFTEGTDAEALARQYVSTLQELQLENPQTRFVAITTPLTTVQAGPKAWVKRLLGKAPYGVQENARRHQFNEVVRRHFDEGTLFDLAQLEASDAAAAALHPALTSDGGHLNQLGRELVGAYFAKFIAANAGGGQGS